jgi:CHAD domain-containing protein
MKTPPAVAWNPRRSVAANAAASLPGLAREWFAHGRDAVRPDTTGEQLHAFRLATKRFRYVLELFESAYGPAMEERLKALKKVQTALGDLNDRHTVGTLFEGYDGVPGRARFFAVLDADAAKLTVDFRRHWQETLAQPTAEEEWVNFLANPPRVGRISASARPTPAARPAGRAKG